MQTTIPRHALTRTLTLADLRARLARQRAALRDIAGNDNRAGWAECLAYDIEHTQACLARGVPHVEYFDAAFGQWQDA